MKKLITLSLLLFIIGCDKSTDPPVALCSDGYAEIEGECYYQQDLAIIQDIINLNPSSFIGEESHLPFKSFGRTPYATWGTSVFRNTCSPTDLQPHVEDSGNGQRVLALNLEDIGLTQLPASIGNFSWITILKLNDNQLTSLPSSICDLVNSPIDGPHCAGFYSSSSGEIWYCGITTGGNCLPSEYDTNCIYSFGSQNGCD